MSYGPFVPQSDWQRGNRSGTSAGCWKPTASKLLLLETTQDSFFGLSVGERDGGAAVVVNTWDRISVERWIFAAAHELGHLLLHPAEYRRDATEMQAREWVT